MSSKHNQKPTLSGISNWTPYVYSDDAPEPEKLEQIREFCLTLRENLFETSKEIIELRMRLENDNGDRSRKTSGSTDGKPAPVPGPRETSVQPDFSMKLT